jgi:hypothetical protein
MELEGSCFFNCYQACMCYLQVRNNSYSVVTPLNVKSNWNINKLEAFVTFMHKESKYTGPGTDVLLIRDGYIEIFLPQYLRKKLDLAGADPKISWFCA